MQYSFRLDRFLAKTGLCSRRKAKILIEQGDISINNALCRDSSFHVRPDIDTVKYKTKPCSLVQNKVYYAFHKPSKTESTNKIQREHAMRKTTLSFLQSEYDKHLFSIGRLDYLSTGLLLFTNDGDICYRLTHPKFQIKKVYSICCKNDIPRYILDEWKRGMSIHNVSYTLHSYCYYKNKKKVELTLHEGKNREIRRVFEHFSLPLLQLHRIQFANIELGNLEVGKWRILNDKEQKTLQNIAYNAIQYT